MDIEADYLKIHFHNQLDQLTYLRRSLPNPFVGRLEELYEDVKGICKFLLSSDKEMRERIKQDIEKIKLMYTEPVRQSFADIFNQVMTESIQVTGTQNYTQVCQKLIEMSKVPEEYQGKEESKKNIKFEIGDIVRRATGWKTRGRDPIMFSDEIYEIDNIDGEDAVIHDEPGYKGIHDVPLSDLILVLSKKEMEERERLFELQKDSTRWFTQEEQNRLKELGDKLFKK